MAACHQYADDDRHIPYDVLIQNTQNRDNDALHAQLDEFIRAAIDADNEFIGIEHLTDQELRTILAKVEANSKRVRDKTKVQSWPLMRDISSRNETRRRVGS